MAENNSSISLHALVPTALIMAQVQFYFTNITPKTFRAVFFYVLLIMHLRIILVINQLSAQILVL